MLILPNYGLHVFKVVIIHDKLIIR